MTAISNTFSPSASHGRAHRHENHLLWRGIGFALAVVSIVLAANLLQTRGTAGDPMSGWAGIENRQLPAGWEDSVPLDLLPLGVLPPEASR